MGNPIARRGRSLTVRALVAAGALALLVAITSAAADATRTATANVSSASLTIAVQNVPATLDPGKAPNGGNNVTFAALAYDSLIYLAPNGKHVPDLATSWKYVGNKNEVFVINLRPNVKFSDGSTMTAQDVVQSIQYAKAGGSTAASFLASLTSVAATGPLQVTLTFSAPRPDLPTVFDQNRMAGDIIGPNGRATPTNLGTQTDGAGPYKLDPTKTVTGSTYVYVPNPNYWNSSLRRYSSVTVNVIADSNAAFNAIQTGQADFLFGGAATQASAAKKAGLQVYAAPYGWTCLFITDYRGTLVKALGSQKVRQAISYATNRPLLAKALYGPYAVPESQNTAPGYTGYDPRYADYYHYNIQKAKQLLAEAGYPHGFTMSVVSIPLQNIKQETEALAGELAQIGVKFKIHEDATFGEAVTDWLGGKYPAFIGTYGTLPFSIQSPELYEKKALFNVFHNPQPKILSLVAKANMLNGEAANKMYQQAEVVSLKQAIFDVLFLSDNLYFARPGKIANLQIGTAYPGADFAPDAAFFSPPSG